MVELAQRLNKMKKDIVPIEEEVNLNEQEIISAQYQDDDSLKEIERSIISKSPLEETVMYLLFRIQNMSTELSAYKKKSSADPLNFEI